MNEHQCMNIIQNIFFLLRVILGASKNFPDQNNIEMSEIDLHLISCLFCAKYWNIGRNVKSKLKNVLKYYTPVMPTWRNLSYYCSAINPNFQ